MRAGDGFSTPDIEEARVKTEAIQRCNKRYVLADPPNTINCIRSSSRIYPKPLLSQLLYRINNSAPTRP